MADLFKHQSEGVTFLGKRKGAILADEMGLGKTRQAIVALGQASDHLNVIVCPATLKDNWEKEIRMVFPEDDVLVSGKTVSAVALRKLEHHDPAWLIINYEQQGKWIGELLKRKYCLVGDEAHYIKGSSARTKYFLMLAEHAKRVYLLTGTPILNRPIELYNLLRAVKHPLGQHGGKGRYAERYCGARAMASVVDKEKNFSHFIVHRSQSHAFRYNPRRYVVRYFTDMRGATNLEELRKKIDPVFLRRMKEEVLDLPEKIETRVDVVLGRKDRKRYDSAFDDYVKFLRENPMEGKNINNILLAKHLVELQKLKQVCSEAKIGRVVEDVENALEQDEPAVIFTQYRATLSAFAKHWPLAVTIDGETPIHKRQAIVDAFQAGKAKVFVGNVKAAGVGITLTAASNVYFADLDWTPAVHDQAADRCHRIGQTGTVNVRYYVAKDTLEEDIMEMLASKREVIRRVLSGEEVEKSAQSGVADVVSRLSTRVSRL